jgi:excisionase family DNA binding protein
MLQPFATINLMDAHAHSPPPIERHAYALGEVAQSLGLSIGMVYKLIEAGQLRTFKLGRRRLVPPDELRRLCAVREVA